ncbi:hypothetical protein [Lewinella sp. LCG006]|uniref:hypothetical protein n=1 Tax=Lewinella sp. LCG006 TaxID=3231911 RepID=UPI0034612C2E
MNYSYYLGLIFLFFSLSSCDQENYLDIETNYDTTPLQIKGAYQGPDEADFVDFEINIGKLDVNHQYLYWGADVSEGELGPTLIAGVYTSANTWYGSVRYFGLQFWSDQLPANRRWTSAELEQFFAPSNVFELGQGPGLVDIAYRYPGVENTGTLDDISSKSSFLESPAGQLVITKVEEYQFTGIRLAQNSPPTYDGKLVSCLINAEVGLNRNTPTQGNTVSLVTDEVLTLRNVEVTFFVSY